MNRLARFASASALALTFSSCSDGTSPGDLDPAVLQNRMQGVVNTFQNNAAFNSLMTMSAFMPCYNPACTPLMEGVSLPMLSRTGSLSSRVAAARRLMSSRSLEMSSLSDIQALFPQNVLGKTLEWSTQSSAYVIGNGTGAPANGVRVLLYVVDQFGGGPVVPLQQLGYVEFTDLSTAQYDRLGVLLRLGSTTIADYHVTNTVTTTLNTLRAVGRLNDADLSDYADFDITAAGDNQDLFSLDETITGSDGTAITISLGGNTTTSNVLIGVAAEGNELEFDVSETGEVITGEVTYNGVTIANVNGDTDTELTFTGVDGNELDDDTVEAFGFIFGMATLFALVLTFGILGPAAIVF